jgi:hypothetical protein
VWRPSARPRWLERVHVSHSRGLGGLAYTSLVAQPHERDWGFFYWAAVGFSIPLGLISIATLPLLAVGVWMFIVGVRRGPPWPADVGLVAGVGVACVVIAFLLAADGSSSPVALATAGAALAVAASGAFWWLRCRPGLR